MRRLMILRHAKSSWSDPNLSDFDRPLNARGRQAAPDMGRYMRDHGLLPDRILCSTAQRARETLAGILPFLRNELSICLTPKLYEARAGMILDTIRTEGSCAPTLMVIGHNPGLQTCANELIGGGDGQLAGSLAQHFPTAALAVIDFDVQSWARIDAGTGRIIAFCHPKQLAAAGATVDDTASPDAMPSQ